MGVYKLWEILLTTAVSKSSNDLSGMILAVDASLWIVKANSIYEQQSAQIKCLFKKILWLIQHNIKPIFVFDGTPPSLKRKTLEERRKRRRELHDFEISKKVELQILKKIKEPQNAGAQSSNSQRESELKQKQIDQMLAELLKMEEPQKPVELEEKMVLQGKVLSKKYQLYAQIYPAIYEKYGTLEYFTQLDLETKELYLTQIQQEDLPSGRQLRAVKKTMTDEEKMIYEMQMIRKKSEIRELQDNLYRKVMMKKQENGYEIIEGIYKGKKVTQKRKIKGRQGYNQFGYYKGKNGPKNNFKEIFTHKRQMEKERSQMRSEEPTDFFSTIFTKDYSNKQPEDSQNTFKSIISQRLSSQTQNRKKKRSQSNSVSSHKSKSSNSSLRNSGQVRGSNSLLKRHQSEQRKRKTKQEIKSLFDEDEQQYDFLQEFKQVEIQKKQIKEVQEEQNDHEDPDHFPDFIKMQELDYMSRTTNNNVHLQNILSALGIPFVIAPAEAEAQCAYLEMSGMADGVITEDSDVFLFGARKVYRGVFQQNIKYYSMELIERKLHLTRQKMILFGLMLGSDYSDGVKGIGVVNAMEILKVHQTLQNLQKFTQWARTADDFQDQQWKTDNILNQRISEHEKQFYELHRKYKNYWHVHPQFPSQNVYDAYQHPEVIEKSKIKFKEQPQMLIIEQIMRQKFLMNKQEIDHNLKVLSKKFKRKGQQSITEFLVGDQYARIRSKRLQRAIQ